MRKGKLCVDHFFICVMTTDHCSSYLVNRIRAFHHQFQRQRVDPKGEDPEGNAGRHNGGAGATLAHEIRQQTHGQDAEAATDLRKLKSFRLMNSSKLRMVKRLLILREKKDQPFGHQRSLG